MSIPKYKVTLDKETHIYNVKLPDGTVINPPSFSYICRKYQLIPDYYGDPWYGTRGTAIHIGTELIDKGILDWSTVQKELIPFLEAYVQFKIDTRMEFDNIEVSFYHPEWHFCTTLDRFLPIVDIKSGQGYPIQLAVQGEVLRANGIDPGVEAFMLTLKENRRYTFQSYKFYKLKDELEDFKAACRLNIRKEIHNGIM